MNYLELANELGIKGRVNNHQLVTRCPMHHDQNPSFSLNVDSGLWTCFAQCGSGNFRHLVMKIFDCTLAEAADWELRSSSAMPVRNPDVPEIERLPSYQWLYAFQAQDRNYLPQWWFDRGFTWDTAERWDIRYDKETAKLYIPYYISDGDGLIGTVVRNLKSEPKYQNSPGLPRSQHLFGLAQASGSLIYITEGALDCVWLQQCGFFPVAALLGLNMSMEHVRLLRDFEEICLLLDSDEAGQQAIQAACTRLVSSGRSPHSVTTVTLPTGRKDVGECTAEELQQALAERKPV